MASRRAHWLLTTGYSGRGTPSGSQTSARVFQATSFRGTWPAPLISAARRWPRSPGRTISAIPSTVSLAAYLAPHRINVNAIAPGTIETELSAGTMDPEQFAATRERRLSMIPLGRLGQPTDLVGAAIFLCSDEASYVTGHTLVVDGGLLAV